MNDAAAKVLSDTDRAPLWEMASRAMAAGDRAPLTYVARGGTQMAGRLTPIYDCDTVVAALVRFGPPARRPPRPGRVTFGWASLTDAELSLVELVARGLTNREAAAKLYLSPHTVDSHLRHIFRKLDIRSRVELARLSASRTLLRSSALTETGSDPRSLVRSGELLYVDAGFGRIEFFVTIAKAGRQ